MAMLYKTRHRIPGRWCGGPRHKLLDANELAHLALDLLLILATYFLPFRWGLPFMFTTCLVLLVGCTRCIAMAVSADPSYNLLLGVADIMP